MQCDVMKTKIRATIEKVYETVGTAGENEDDPQTKLADICKVVDGEGRVDTETVFAKTLLALDTAEEIAAIDAQVTKLKLQTVLGETCGADAEANNGLLQQLTEIGTLKAVITAFVSIVKCERACRAWAGTPSGTKQETQLIEAMRDMLTNTKSFEASEASAIATAKANFSTWKSNLCVQLRNMTKSLYEELRVQVTEINGMLFDLDNLTKPAKVDECVSTMRNWGGKADLMKVLKTFQGAGGRGVKHFEAMTSTLGCAGIFSPGPEMQAFACVARPLQAGEKGQATMKTYKELHEDFLKIRQSARLQLSLRSAAIIIHAGDAASVPAFERDIKPLKVTMPKAIKDKLAGLKK